MGKKGTRAGDVGAVAVVGFDSYARRGIGWAKARCYWSDPR